MLTIQEKVQLIRKITQENDISSYTIGEETSVNQKTAYNVLNDDTIKPRNKTLNIILSYLEDKIAGSDINNIDDFRKKTAEKSHKKFKGIPFYDIEFSENTHSLILQNKIEPNYYVVDPYFYDCDFIVKAKGMSMERIIKHGEAVGLKKILNWQEFFTLGEVYAIVTDNELTTIKIITQSDRDGYYKLISKPYSENKDQYPNQEIHKKMIHSIYKVQASRFLF